MNKGAIGKEGPFISPLLPIPATGAYVVKVQHGRSAPPRFFRWVLVNVRPDAGYAIGDELDYVSGYNNNTVPTVWANGAEIGTALVNGQALAHFHKTTGATTNLTNVPVNWALRVYAYWF